MGQRSPADVPVKQPKPISIPPEIAARCDGPDQFQKFDALVRSVLAVPHSEIVKREAAWKKSRARKKDKRPQA